MPETPKPPPVQVPPVQGEETPAPSRLQYEDIADRVGFVPNLRLGDNLIQGGSVLVGMAVGALVGYLMKWGDPNVPLLGAGLGAVAGLVLATFVSGLYLAIRNLQRRR